MLKLKMIARKILILLLKLISIKLVDRIRNSYINENSETYKKILLHKLLSVLSYKDISKSIESFEVDNNTPFKLTTCHSVLINQLYFFGNGGYEPLESLYWERLCRQSKGILELGANVGYHTIQGVLANPDARYIAVEPHPVNASLLKKNLALNGIANVEIIEAAVVGNKSGDKMTLAVPVNDFQDSPSGCYLSEGAEAIKRISKQSISVDVIEVNELIDGIDLIKIDVEGYEYNILSSMRQYITDNKPVIFVEVLNKADNLKKFLFELSEKCGYKLYCFSKSGLVAIDPQAILKIYVQEEFISRDVILSTKTLKSQSIYLR